MGQGAIIIHKKSYLWWWLIFGLSISGALAVVFFRWIHADIPVTGGDSHDVPETGNTLHYLALAICGLAVFMAVIREMKR